MKFAKSSFNRQNISFCSEINACKTIDKKQQHHNQYPQSLLRKSKGTNESIKNESPKLYSSHKRTLSYQERTSTQLSHSSLSNKTFNQQFKEKKMSKTIAIQQFKLLLNSVRDSIFQNQCQIDIAAKNFDQQYANNIQFVDSQFEQIFELLNVRYEKCLENIKQKYQNLKKNIAKYSDTIEQIQELFEQTEEDIDKNYSLIVNELNLQTFANIMIGYKNQLTVSTIKIQNMPDLTLQIQQQKQMINNMIYWLIPKSNTNKKQKFEDAQQQSDTNSFNIHMSSHKTQKYCKK